MKLNQIHSVRDSSIDRLLGPIISAECICGRRFVVDRRLALSPVVNKMNRLRFVLFL